MHVDIDVLSNPLFPDDKHVLSPLPVHILHSKALSVISPVMEEIERISFKKISLEPYTNDGLQNYVIKGGL
jgi:hypothetical protein